mmetsp:Transcript_12324/g.33874  ORF Transcript_12324/g.33874 Transcript_12324/m.33874 type:complete len:207 (-) Transcript_12324:387-1007(-)
MQTAEWIGMLPRDVERRMSQPGVLHVCCNHILERIRVGDVGSVHAIHCLVQCVRPRLVENDIEEEAASRHVLDVRAVGDDLLRDGMDVLGPGEGDGASQFGHDIHHIELLAVGAKQCGRVIDQPFHVHVQGQAWRGWLSDGKASVGGELIHDRGHGSQRGGCRDDIFKGVSVCQRLAFRIPPQSIRIDGVVRKPQSMREAWLGGRL